MRKVTEDFIGTCQACFGEFKVNENSHHIVLHGYKRPGDGYIIGNCRGTDHLPFEYGYELTKEIIDDHLGIALRRDQYLAKLKAGEVTEIRRMEREYDRETQRYKNVLNTYTPDSENWDWMVKTEIARTEGDIDHHTRVARFLQAKVDAWQVGMIIGIDTPTTGRERALRKAYDPAEEDAAAARAAEKAKRDAKPGKLALIFYQPSEPRPGTYQEIGETEWRKWHERKDAKEKAFAATIKQWAKANITGKTIVRPQIGDYDLPRDIRGTGDFDVVIVNLPWEYRDQITTMFSTAVPYANEPKKVSYVLAGGPEPH